MGFTSDKGFCAHGLVRLCIVLVCTSKYIIIAEIRQQGMQLATDLHVLGICPTEIEQLAPRKRFMGTIPTRRCFLALMP